MTTCTCLPIDPKCTCQRAPIKWDDYTLLAVSGELLGQHRKFGHWVDFEEALETMRGLMPNVACVIDLATDTVVWEA